MEKWKFGIYKILSKLDIANQVQLRIVNGLLMIESLSQQLSLQD
jgi:hypothetical protein